MSEHPMITAMREARLIAANKGDDIAVCNAALQWLKGPKNVSELMSEAGVNAMWDDGAPDVIFTAMINALIKEIEGQ